MGNVLKDVYLNLDSRTEKFEIDKRGIEWLDFGFNASEHHFFNRGSSFGGAAVTLEVLKKLGITASIAGNSIDFTDDAFIINDPTEVYRYILVSDHGVSYLAPSRFKSTAFVAPDEHYDYLFVDRSASIDDDVARKINNYLDSSRDTKLVLYLRDMHHLPPDELINRAALLFVEQSSAAFLEEQYVPELSQIDSAKIIYLSEKSLTYLKITESISRQQIDKMTHLSMYSIAAGTILGCFILGETVEDSLKLARANVENSQLDAVLTLDELKSIDQESGNNLRLIAASLMLKGKGILAADESGGNIHQKFTDLNIPDTYETRRKYRNLLLATPDLAKYLNGVILFDETTNQMTDDGRNFVEYLTSERIIPGVKVDQGLEKFKGSEETFTKGLDNLDERLKRYYDAELRFAKWRAAFEIRTDKDGRILSPTDYAIDENCRILAEYAKKCQSAGLVPIVEPEVVYDGDYDINQSAVVTGRILDALFAKLILAGVDLRACILKCNMVLAGKKSSTQSTPDEVGRMTARVLKSHVPKALAGIVFLSGGQTPEQATENLAAVLKHGPFPWPITFSFARALQEPALTTWVGDEQNIEKARQAFLDRLVANTDALD